MSLWSVLFITELLSRCCFNCCLNLAIPTPMNALNWLNGIRLFGSASLDCLTADREFVGEQWIKYLNEQRIRYYIRIRENFWVLQPYNGKRVKASWLFSDLPLNGCWVNHRIVYLNNQLCYLSASKGKDKEGKPELQIIISFNKPEDALEIYKERWQIELFFKAIKQQLKVKSFVGTSKNALLSQLWVALITYLLLSYLKFKSRFSWSLYTLCSILPANLFARRNLWDWLNARSMNGASRLQRSYS